MLKKIGIASDHAGFEYKQIIAAYLRGQGHEVSDYGCDTPARTDFPRYAERAARAVLSGAVEAAILICGTGMGMSIAANKFPGIRCAACSEPYTARLTKQHNNANILAFGARVVGIEVAKMMVDEWLNAAYDPRHQFRLDMLTELEKRASQI